MGFFRRKSRHHAARHAAKHTDNLLIENEPGNKICDMNIGQYIGQTITVFVNAGGPAGNGFTGILMSCSAAYIRLLVMPSMPPSCSLGNACSSKAGNAQFCILCPFNRNTSVGSAVIIPLNNIVAFVHNTLSSS